MRTDLRVLVRLATRLFVDGPTTMWLLLGARISLGTQPSPLAYIALCLLLQRSYARWNRWRAIVSGFASSCKRRFNGTRGTRFGSLYRSYQRPRLSDATSFKCARLILRQQGFSALRPRSQWLRLLWPVPVAECVPQADCRSGSVPRQTQLSLPQLMSLRPASQILQLLGNGTARRMWSNVRRSLAALPARIKTQRLFGLRPFKHIFQNPISKIAPYFCLLFVGFIPPGCGAALKLYALLFPSALCRYRSSFRQRVLPA